VDYEKRLLDLEREIRQQNRTLAGIQHWLKVAAEYRNDDPVKQVEGMQAAIFKASEYVGRTQRSNRRER
jgi:hypothetical protein